MIALERQILKYSMNPLTNMSGKIFTTFSFFSIHCKIRTLTKMQPKFHPFSFSFDWINWVNSIRFQKVGVCCGHSTSTGCPVNWYSLSISIPDFSDCPIKKI